MSDLSKLIKAHNGDMALYYIWLQVNGEGSVEQAARDLCMPISRVETAIEMLKLYDISCPDKETSPIKNDVTTPASFNAVMPADEVKTYTSEQLKQVSESDPVFTSIINEATHCLGKVLNKDDLTKLLDIYHNLGMDPQVLFVLLHYSKSISDKVRFSMYNVSKRAYSWNDMGIDNVEKAEQYVEKMRIVSSREGNIKSIFKIDYDLTPHQRELVEKWVSAAYSDDMIRRAYEITLEKTNKLAWNYLDKVLSNMEEKQSVTGSENDYATVGRPLPKTLRSKSKK